VSITKNVDIYLFNVININLKKSTISQQSNKFKGQRRKLFHEGGSELYVMDVKKIKGDATKIVLKILRCEVMNSEFWNIFQWISNGFSDRIPIGTVPSPVLWAAKLFFGRQHFYFFGQQNYFFGSKSGQQKLFFWAARIIFLSSKYFSYRNSKFWFI
jgi:hypothetical protein